MIDKEEEIINEISNRLDNSFWEEKKIDVALAIYLKRRDDLKLEDDEDD